MVIVALLITVGCKASTTGKVVQEPINDPDVTKTLVQEDGDGKATQTPQEENQTAPQKDGPQETGESCQQQIDNLKDEIDTKRAKLLQASANLTKASLLAQHLKNTYGKEEDYKKHLEDLDEIADRKKKIGSEVKSGVAALKMLAEKCKIKLRLDRD